ncbi:MAG TPA: GGDEF domain-containing protein [bacterium]|nr:GGDEF domain-containing protein [bacterium]
MLGAAGPASLAGEGLQRTRALTHVAGFRFLDDTDGGAQAGACPRTANRVSVQESRTFSQALSAAAGRISGEWADRLTAIPIFGTRSGESLRATCLTYLHSLARWLVQRDDEELRQAVTGQTKADIQAGLTAADAVKVYLALQDVLWDELDRWAVGRPTLASFEAVAKHLAAGMGLSVQAAMVEYQRVTATQLALQREEQERLALSLERAQVNDALTGLYTRAYCLEYLDREVRRAHRYGYAVSLLVVDVDGFDAVVASLDATGGDAVIRGIAEQLASAVREVDLVCRLGTDVFGVVLPHIRARPASVVAERLRTIVENWMPAVSNIQLDRQVTVSVGVAGLPDDASTADELLLRAEAARTHAKRIGKNVVVAAADLPT